MQAVFLETARLILRPWRDSDLDALAALNADPEVMRHFPAPLTRAQTEEWIGRLQARERAQGWAPHAIERKADGAFIGLAGLNRPTWDAPFTPCVEIGWRLARPYWGEGYAIEAARAELAFGFGELELDEIVSFTVSANTRSWGVMERLGMSRDRDGDFDHPMVPDGHPLKRHVLYRLSAARWAAGSVRPSL
jgi:RimJ/RimL family protein N-acetyltransferase